MQKQAFSSIKPLEKALSDLIEGLGINKKLREYDAVVRWGEIVGEQIGRVTIATKIEKGVLIVKVSNGPWRNELTLMKRQVVDKLNDALGEVVVKDIRFV